VKIHYREKKQTFIISDFFSVYEKGSDVPEIYKWSDLVSVSENKADFTLNTGVKSYVIPKSLITDPVQLIRARAIIEGAISINPNVDYKFGKRILPPKTLCTGCEVPRDAYVAVGSYTEKEVNNANVVLLNSGFDKLIIAVFPIATVAAFVLMWVLWGEVLNNLIKFIPISLFAGGATSMVVYLLCAFSAKTLYSRILKEDPALLEDITFVICEDGFIAAESEVYDFCNIISWNESAFFIETNHAYIVFKDKQAVFWLPKRLFPKNKHKEVGDFIADRLQQK